MNFGKDFKYEITHHIEGLKDEDTILKNTEVGKIISVSQLIKLLEKFEKNYPNCCIEDLSLFIVDESKDDVHYTLNIY